eukprot:CAMPEP_0170630998 /NCGR_PEP_ID=MMETSP0224-20130122/34350_1 /TAXON_ID=285029 /ORGANISM="Togula jolla, Strain CCCM 725" /LENGTH=553 /DNA_ID=CAMNT_0010959195 /DNA_START=23 /DNA_END=1684 /DNA_ORIENTATION=-
MSDGGGDFGGGDDGGGFDGGFDDGGFDGGGSEGSFGGGGGGGGNTVQGMCCACLLGLLLYPAALGFTGWNEKRAVCRAKVLWTAEEEAFDLDCNDNEAHGLQQGDLGYLNCPLDNATFQQYTEENSFFSGLSGVTALFGSPVSAAAMSMEVQMLVCVEYCAKEACRRRRLEEIDEQNESEIMAMGTAEELDWNATDEEHETWQPLRRLRSHSSSSSCRKECVEWGYKKEWSKTLGASGFKDNGRAERACGRPNPLSAGNGLSLGTHEDHAPSGQVRTDGGAWRLNDAQMKMLPIDVSVPAVAGDQSFQQAGVQPPPALNRGNTLVSQGTLLTCTAEKVGCLRVSFMKSAPKTITMLGAISDQPGMMSEEGWQPPDGFLCKSQQPLNRICPKKFEFDLLRGGTGCNEGPTRDELFATMKSENSTTTWLYRLIGFLCTWLGLCMILCPITTIVEMAASMLDNITACIPGVGCMVDMMTDMIVGVVQSLICLISCMCAVSSFFFVAAAMWMIMRPLIAIPLFLVGVCLCGAGCFFAHKGKDHSRDRHAKMHDGDLE